MKMRLRPQIRLRPESWTTEALFATALCIACLALQRFGIVVGSSSQLFLSLAVSPIVLAILLILGHARVNAGKLLLYLCTASCFLVTTFLAILYPDFSFRFSLMSVEEIGLLYLVFIFEPRGKFSGDIVLKVFVFWARMIATLGVFQYGLQFAGLRLFSFTNLHVPSSLLMESAFHTVAPITYGSSILRSNGFFLLEPSIFSQIMALACIVDAFVLGRFKYLPLYGLGLLVSFSGTGVVILAITLTLTGLSNSRQLPRVLGLLILGGALIFVAAVFSPEQFATLQARASGSDPSAHARYLEQLDVLNTIRSDPRLFQGFGPGSADGFVPLGSMSAALKLLFDYGVLGTIFFGLFLIAALWRRDEPVLTIAGVLTFQLGGGYLLFPPMVILIAMLCIWSRPSASVKAAFDRPWGRGASTTMAIT